MLSCYYVCDYRAFMCVVSAYMYARTPLADSVLGERATHRNRSGRNLPAIDISLLLSPTRLPLPQLSNFATHLNALDTGGGEIFRGIFCPPAQA